LKSWVKFSKTQGRDQNAKLTKYSGDAKNPRKMASLGVRGAEGAMQTVLAYAEHL
jgi:hypothetical protein